MSIDTVARPIVVTLRYADNSNALNVTELLHSLSFSYRRLDDSGLITKDGNLKLYKPHLSTFSENLDPRLNQRRFARGARVQVQVPDSGGDLVTLARLRILRAPANGDVLEIPIGCLLRLMDFRSPPDDEAGVTLGEESTRTAIINNLAAKAGIGNLADSISAYPISYPIPRFSGSYISQMGAIAYSAGYVLYIDGNEDLRAKAIDLSATADLSLQHGQDDASFEYLTPEETPCEVVKAAAIVPEIKPTLDPEPALSIASSDDYNPSQIARSTYSGAGTNSPLSYQNIKTPKGLLMPEQYPNSASLSTQEEFKYDFYAPDETRILQRSVQISTAPKGVVMPDFFPGDASRTTARRTLYIPSWQDDRVVLTTLTYEPQGLINPETDPINRLRLGLSAFDQEVYRKTNRGWSKTTYQRRYKKGETSSASTTYSSAGGNTPPAPEHADEPYYSEDKQLCGECKLDLGGSAFNERSRVFQFDYCVSQTQLDMLAQLQAKLLVGRNWAIGWSGEIADEWLDGEPLKVVEWAEYDPSEETWQTHRYLAVGESFAFAEKQAALACDGFYLGKVSGGALTPPYTQYLQIEQMLELEVAIVLGEPAAPIATLSHTQVFDLISVLNFGVIA